MHILIAPNAFKNSLNAEEAALAIQEGFSRSLLDCTCECFPVGDGGDGTAELIVKKFEGINVSAEVSDPLDRKIKASYGLIDDGRTAVIEMADASGLRLLDPSELSPLRASSSGTGELIKVALAKGAKKIIVGMGGSATVDGGSGILAALGVRFLDKSDNVLSGIPESLVDLVRIDVSDLDKRILDCELIVLCDVENTLLGDKGAVRVFGPQKGAGINDIPKLEAALEKFAEVALAQFGNDMSAIKGGGTAGGAAAGLYGLLNAKLLNGIDHFLQLTGFDKALDKADLVITGEGSIDEQTLHGKGPFGVAYRAKLKNIPVIGLAGKVPSEEISSLHEYFDVLMPIGNEPCDLAMAMKSTAENLIRTSNGIGNLLALKQKT